MKNVIFGFAALSFVLFAQVSGATPANGVESDETLVQTLNRLEGQQSVVMVNTETNETIRVDENGVVSPVAESDLAMMDSQINTSDEPSVMHTAAYIGGGVNLGPIGGGIGVNRCGINFGVHLGPIGVGAGGGCHGFWRGGRWHHGYWHRPHGRYHGHWARLF